MKAAWATADGIGLAFGKGKIPAGWGDARADTEDGGQLIEERINADRMERDIRARHGF